MACRSSGWRCGNSERTQKLIADMADVPEIKELAATGLLLQSIETRAGCGSPESQAHARSVSCASGTTRSKASAAHLMR